MVNVESGVVTTPAVRDGIKLIYHPVSGTKVIGFKIPYWKDALTMVCSAAESIPDAPFVGWDVCILPDGPCLIEGNTGSNDYELMQAADLEGKWNLILNIDDSATLS